MRQGFSKSEGGYIGGSGCNVESNGNVQAEDVKAVLDFVVRQPWARKDQILVAGQSHGGWTTLAFGQENYPGVRGLINFAGGLKQDSCAAWQTALGRAVSEYARNTKSPSLWFYGDNDSYFSSFTYKDMFERYISSGGQAELVAFGLFGTDSHAMFGSRSGEAIWQPKVEQFMKKLDLPTEVIFPEFAASPQMALPPATNFAEVHDVNAIPFIGEKGRDGYRSFLTKNHPRAFVISESGRWSWAEMGDDPLKRALDTCRKNSETECRLYAVDDQVVWKKD
jgi:dienelactone hydrolase